MVVLHSLCPDQICPDQILMFVCFQLIMVPGYTQEEKIAISKRHLLPKQLKVGVLLS